jgi:MSHA biogenesis protein MshP
MSTMCPDAPIMKRRDGAARAPGFALVSAIFLITVLAALAAFIAYFSSTQQASSEADLMGARAYQAARSGVEWGAYQSLISSSCPGAATPTNLAFAGSTLAAFTVTVTCVRNTYFEGGVSVTIDRITANACTQPSGGGTCPNAAATASTYYERDLTVSTGTP